MLTLISKITNFAYTIAPDNSNAGNLRETFFFNQLDYKHKVTYTAETDFKVDNKYWLYIDLGG